MTTVSWMTALALALAGAAGPSGRWLGQDGHDLTSASPELKPNGYQDIHIILSELPLDRVLKKIVIRPYGAGEWVYNGPPGSWPAALVRSPGSRTADLFLETDRIENGRQFHLQLFYDDGSTGEIYVKGGKSDPNRRMPKAGPDAAWAGQENRDLVGTAAGAGPDGYRDARIRLTGIPTRPEIQHVTIEAPGGSRWQAGLNPKAEPYAELIRDPRDRSQGDLFFQPDRDLGGLPLTVTLRYNNGKADVIRLKGEATHPKSPMPRVPLPELLASDLQGRWLGQDGSRDSRAGDVHVALSNLPHSGVVAAVLTDSVKGSWVFRNNDQIKLDAGPDQRPLVLKRGNDQTRADLYFTPYRDEAGATLTVRLLLQDGSTAVAQIVGGQCDPMRTVAPVARTSVTAKPGDDLNALAGRFGTIRLSAGPFRLSQPLILEKPVALIGQKGTILEFTQPANTAPWSSAIKIHSGPTTLRDFAVRFEGPVRWESRVIYGPAVIGATDSLDSPHPDSKLGLKIEGLDVVAPPIVKTKDWEEAVRLMRLLNVQGGEVSRCTFRGGTIEFFGGPWKFVENEYQGTVAGTFSYGFLAGHEVHDVLVRGNRTSQVGDAGKTWRFLVLTNWGNTVAVESNRVEGIGPRDNDTITLDNTPETLITESYKLRFEGKPSAVSNDGRLLGIAEFQGEPPQVGDVVSILSGASAGQWRTVAQVLSPSVLFLTTPLPGGTETISISRGFTQTRIEGNAIDTRGSRAAVNLLLGGNHFGTLIRRNHIRGGREAFRFEAPPTEAPGIWGWSHTPFLGVAIEENVIEDSFLGAHMGVDHGPQIRANSGRTYMAVVLRNNLVRWTGPFLRERSQAREKAPLLGITLGYLPSHDPNEMIAIEDGDRLEIPPGAHPRECLRVRAARLNGRTIRDSTYTLPERTDTSSVRGSRPN